MCKLASERQQNENAAYIIPAKHSPSKTDPTQFIFGFIFEFCFGSSFLVKYEPFNKMKM